MVDRLAEYENKHGGYTEKLAEAARELKCWAYDVRELDTVTDHHPLSVVSYLALSQLGCIRHLNLNDRKLRNFLSAVERSMPDRNFYHNKLHVAAVVQCMYAQLSSSPLEDPLATCACMIAAVVHDCAHPGMSADRWRQVDPDALPEGVSLEEYHLRSAFALMTQPANDFLDGAAPEVRQDLYVLVSELVLATEMARHRELMNDIVRSAIERQSETRPIWLMRLFMKVADLHHCVGSPESHVSWARNLHAETQGRKSDELPSAFAVGQLQFFDKVVLPMIDVMTTCCPGTAPVKRLAQINREIWL